MSGSASGKRFDEEVEASWQQFETALVQRLAGLGHESMVLDIGGRGSDEVEPYVQFIGSGAAGLRAEVSSNHYLGDSHRLGRRQHQALRALGWGAPGRREDNRNWHIDFDLDLVELAASTAVTTLRRVFGVISPAFLPGSRDDEVQAEPPAVDDEAEPFEIGFPTSPDDLQAMVAQVLRERGQDDGLEPDGDGDICVMTGAERGPSHLWVRASASRPALEFWGVVLAEVTDRRQALLEVNVLNRRTPFMRFSLRGEAVFYSSDLGAEPLVAAQFNGRVDYIVQTLTEVAADLAETVNGFPEKRRIPRRPTAESA